MKTYKILSIEDNKDDYRAFIESVERLNDSDKENHYEVHNAKTYEEGMKSISLEFDAVIVDIKLDDGNDGNDGNDIIKEIMENYRLPVLIFTGTPDVQDDALVKVFKKGEASHDEILQYIKKINDTGMFKVLGGRGIIEKRIQDVFWKNIWPMSKEFLKYPSDGLEKKILRYAIANMREYLDQDAGEYLKEEAYIYPPVSPNIISTGNIYKINDKYCIVLSPPCDLVIYNNQLKSDSILVCQIDPDEPVYQKVIENCNKKKWADNLQKVIKNNYVDYYHWLPEHTHFKGGLINFRKVNSYSAVEFRDKFGDALIKTHEFYTKNILNRFSNYYSRQGQPDFDFKNIAQEIGNKISGQQ